MNLSDPTELGRIIKLQLSVPSMTISEINFSLQQLLSGISYYTKTKISENKSTFKKSILTFTRPVQIALDCHNPRGMELISRV